MKHNIFYIKDEILNEYLRVYGRGPHSKDYEYNIAIEAKYYFDIHLKQVHVIGFEQNDNQHDFPRDFSPTIEDVKEILIKYNKEDTPVDFELAPVKDGEFLGYSYPFQIKRFYKASDATSNNELASAINKYANKYGWKDLSLIIVPIIKGKEEDKTGFNVDELKSMLEIQEGALRIVYMAQIMGTSIGFVQLWGSKEAKTESM